MSEFSRERERLTIIIIKKGKKEEEEEYYIHSPLAVVSSLRAYTRLRTYVQVLSECSKMLATAGSSPSTRSCTASHAISHAFTQLNCRTFYCLCSSFFSFLHNFLSQFFFGTAKSFLFLAENIRGAR